MKEITITTIPGYKARLIGRHCPDRHDSSRPWYEDAADYRYMVCVIEKDLSTKKEKT